MTADRKMVKVIPELDLVVSQDILTVPEEPLAVCCAKDYLFISTQNCTMEVFELKTLKLLSKFRTVLPATSIVYNAKGDCLVTLEAKNIQCPSTARVYINWRLANIDTPVRARLAAPFKHNAFVGAPKAETIELNINYAKSVSCISCCQETGLIALAAASTVSIYALNEESEEGLLIIEPFLDITFSFPVEKLAIYVSYVACASHHEAFVVRYLLHGRNKKHWNSALYVKEKYSSLERKSRKTLFDRDFILWSPVNSWKTDDHVMPASRKQAGTLKEVSCLLHGSDVETVLLDSVCREFNIRSVDQKPTEVLGPVEFIRGEPINFMIHNKDNEQVDCRLVTLLFRRFAKVSLSSPSAPISRSRSKTISSPEHYTKENIPYDALHTILLAPCGKLASHGLCCYIANTHYCYIYNLLPRAHLTTSIAFTTPSISLQLDADLIHVLSTQTVDTYTSRHCATATLSPWRNPNSDEDNEEFWLCQPCPSPKQDSTLVSSSKLIGSTAIAVDSNNIIVLTKEAQQPEHRWFMQSLRLSSFHLTSSSWNVYVLRRKSATALSQQFVQLARKFSDFSHPYYYHLLCEAHLLLRSHLMAEPGDNDAATVLREICCLLADYCSTHRQKDSHKLAADYYCVSMLPIGEVCDRFNDQKKKPNALLCYLNQLLYDQTQKHLLSKDLGDFIINFYYKHAPNLLPDVLIHSQFLRQYSLGRTLELVESAHKSSSKHGKKSVDVNLSGRSLNNKFLLCKAFLMELSSRQTEALAVMSEISQEFLVTWATNHHLLLLKKNGLTTLGQLLMKSNKTILLTAMVHHVCKEEVEFHDICKILKTQAEHEVLTLIFLEKFICSKDLSIQLLANAQLLLAEMYLERIRLNISGIDMAQRGTASEILSYGKRYDWLNSLPPFSNTTDALSSTVLDELTLLQVLLCNSMPHKELVIYVSDYVHKNAEVLSPVALSLQVLCWPHMDKLNEAIDVLLSSCPDPIIEYSITIFGQKLNQWKTLLNKLLQLVSQQPVVDEHLSKKYPRLYKRALFYVVEITSPDEFFQLLPAKGSLSFFLPVIERCCQLYAAEQLADEIRTAILS